MTPITVRRGTTAECIGLRGAVLRPGMPISTAHFPGDDEPATFHVVAEQGGAIVGCATFMMRPYPLDHEARRAWQLRGMAVDPTLQGSGVGTSILGESMRILRAQDPPVPDGAILWCKARVGAIPFYERNGWITVGGEFHLPPIGMHKIMRFGAE
jgi:predicted N-acetyltransferase YhbS